MRPEFNYTNEEKIIIRDWKQSLPVNENRRYAYMFIHNGKRDAEGMKLCDHLIASDDGFKMTLVRNITL